MAFIFPGSPPIASGIRTAQNHYDWLEDVLAHLDVLNWFIRAAFGDADGVIAYATDGTDSLKIEATGSVPTMAVMLHAGAGFVDGVPFRVSEEIQSDTMVAPTAEDRIDTIGYNPQTQEIVIYEGEEATPPVALDVSDGEIKLAEIYHRVGETAIYDSDNSGEGYITDERTFVNV